VNVAGQTLVAKEELQQLVRIKPGDVFSRERLTESTKAITDRLGNEGYAFANANAVPQIDKEKKTVSFTILVDPGRRVYVRRISIAGNTRTGRGGATGNAPAGGGVLRFVQDPALPAARRPDPVLR